MTDKSSPAPMKRVSRACTFCRARKSRCDLEVGGGQPPCGRCKKESRECILGTSNRGGSRVRKKNLSISNASIQQPLAAIHDSPANGSSVNNTSSLYQTLQSPIALQIPDPNPPIATVIVDAAEDDTASTAESTIENTIPRNPSDAWQLLKDVATREADQLPAGAGKQTAGQGSQYFPNGNNIQPRGSIDGIHTGISTYRLVREGYLNPEIVHMLVRRFHEHYHCYLPLVPRKYFDPNQLDQFAMVEKHLLTAVLTIASKDLTNPNESHIHACCSRYMHDLISGIAAGHECEVEAVEALLLLAEWEPQGLRNRIDEVGRGEEDRSAWMHVGIALRTGYFLGLDRTAFRQEVAEEAKVDGRKRLAWANCYVSDRLISVRIGRAFWSRGPGPMTGLSHKDFPSLQPVGSSDEDHANIFQATLDLTQLYSNVHDVLYSGMRTSGQMMLMGDYVKYVDEFRMAITRWHHIWGGLVCSPHIKSTLMLSYEYLCLYTNAFAFQATISQAIANKPKDIPSLREHLRNTFREIGSMPDARFIWASVAAAKNFLSILTTHVDPERYLRYYPLRFYLSAVYSAVFLFKARSYGVMDIQEERNVRQLVTQAMDVLKRSSVSAQDPGLRYARLLELLWSQPMKQKVYHSHHPNLHSPAPSDTQLSSSGSIKLDAGGYMHFSPANDFSWLDLDAVGEYVQNDQLPGANANILAPMAGMQQPQIFMPPQGNQWQAPTSGMNWQFDPNTNLLF